ncbi:DUF1064 domain-containing protein [Niallia circulans]|uniref:DUF1064 domain-containing protein n=1 Tax=Niallia circulans TaxID=1397 RepID=A0A941JJP3_NIACI|nr:DUF1064 domain-containing protein [Niallia circulans]MCB5235493.1 DUF1064 domain-containing protein [Niallia circulans]
MRNKYGNKKVVVDNIKFDSRAEATYYEQLKWLLQAKQIKSFKCQPKFLLQEAFKKDGVTVRKIEYIADFEIHNLDGSIEIVDVKGAETKEFLLKKKLFLKKYDYPLKIVTLDKTLGWIELDKLKKIKSGRVKKL